MNFPTGQDEQAARDFIAATYPPAAMIFGGAKPVVIFAAARMGRLFLANLRRAGVQVAAFGDNDQGKWNTEIDGVPVLEPGALLDRHRDSAVVVASLTSENVLFHELRNRGFRHVYPLSYLHYLDPEVFQAPYMDGQFEHCFDPALREAIAAGSSLWSDSESKQLYEKILEYRRSKSMEIYPSVMARHPQYFPPDILAFTQEDILLDAGAYTGDTMQRFAALHPGARNTYYAFEPDPQTYQSLLLEGGRYPGTFLGVNAGLGDREGLLGFICQGGMDSAFTAGEAELQIPVHTIDDYFSSRPAPTFIKMDIEGMEPQALAGAERCIRRTRPKLAICVYHRPSHLWEIPLMVRSWNPEYRFYLRHYTATLSETVMYAV